MKHTEDKYTPGPWKLQLLQDGRKGYPGWKTYCIREQKTNVHISTVGSVDRYYEKNNLRNAILMASAPDLLEACKLALYDTELDDETKVKVLESAVAKAEGKGD